MKRKKAHAEQSCKTYVRPIKAVGRVYSFVSREYIDYCQ